MKSKPIPEQEPLIRMIKSTAKKSKAADNLIERAKAKTVRVEGSCEKLSKLLTEEAARFLSYRSPVSYFTSPENIKMFGKIIKKISDIDATIEEFVWFVFQRDWKWLDDGVPYVRIISGDAFLESFHWYIDNKELLKETATILDLYEKTSGVSIERNLANQKYALRLQSILTQQDISPITFFNYTTTINWKFSYPSLSFLISDRFFIQFEQYMRINKPVQKVVKKTPYLINILNQLEQKPLTSSQYEDYNWDVAESIFTPLQSFIGKESDYLDLLIDTAINKKHLPAFGWYTVTELGELTPLSVYWIVFASKNIRNFFNIKQGNWYDIIREKSHSYVNLTVLGGENI